METRSGALPEACLDLPGELRIEIDAGPQLREVRFEGTAAQLEAEGLIPAGFHWPVALRQVECDVGGMTYRLSPIRLRGWKGPMRSWLVLDHWMLHVRREGCELLWWPVLMDSQPPAQRRLQEVSPAVMAVVRLDGRFRAFVVQIPSLALALGYGRHYRSTTGLQ
jgi:hypothetical protein